MWGLYKRTSYRKSITKGDFVIIYLAGHREGCRKFVASCYVADKIDRNDRVNIDGDDILADQPESILMLDGISLFSSPVSILNIKDQLRFIPKIQRWGCVLQGGVKKIDQADRDKIISLSND